MLLVIDVPDDTFDILKRKKNLTIDELIILNGIPLQTYIGKRVEYGTDGNMYEMSISNGKEYEGVIKMREATTEELESVNNYIKSISKPTGVNIWDEIENEKKIDKIKVGDEVIVQDYIVGFVTEIDSSSGEIHVTTEHGWSDVFHKNFVKKTGRYFPNVAAILKAKFMKEADKEVKE